MRGARLPVPLLLVLASVLAGASPARAVRLEPDAFTAPAQVVAFPDLAGAPELTILPATVPEGDGPGVVTVPVRLSAPFPTAQVVVVATTRGVGPEGATPGLDYEDREQPVRFAPGQVEAELPVPVLGDRLDEPDERFWVYLRASAVVREPPEQTAVPVTIADDDAPEAPLVTPVVDDRAAAPAPTPVEPDGAGLAVRLAAPRLVGASAVAVAISCVAPAGSCTGSATASVAGADARGAVSTFRLPDARRRTVRLRLPRAARARLRAKRSVRVQTTVRVQEPRGEAVVRSRSARLRLRPRG
jgi:hypothetical protein